MTYVVAAGNDNGDACDLSPARMPEVITVGASTRNDGKLYSSNHGSCVDLFAPGELIRSAWSGSPINYRLESGTSMAAALYLSKNPTAAPHQVATAIMGDASKNKLTGVPAGTANRLLYRVFGPVVKSLHCESALNMLVCDAAVGGGSNLALAWKRNGVHNPAWDNDLTITDPCSTGSAVSIHLTVTDPNGHFDLAATSVVCRSGALP
ncbi:S8 family serine peptidase [Actinokineospora sp. 24-640]